MLWMLVLPNFLKHCSFKFLCQRLKAKRESLNLTQAELAEKVNLSNNFVGMIERGERNTKFTNVYKLISVLGSNLEEFFKGM